MIWGNVNMELKQGLDYESYKHLVALLCKVVLVSCYEIIFLAGIVKNTEVLRTIKKVGWIQIWRNHLKITCTHFLAHQIYSPCCFFCISHATIIKTGTKIPKTTSFICCQLPSDPEEEGWCLFDSRGQSMLGSGFSGKRGQQ